MVIVNLHRFFLFYSKSRTVFPHCLPLSSFCDNVPSSSTFEFTDSLPLSRHCVIDSSDSLSFFAPFVFIKRGCTRVERAQSFQGYFPLLLAIDRFCVPSPAQTSDDDSLFSTCLFVSSKHCHPEEEDTVTNA